MVRIRLRRTGAKNNPTYRIVVADQNSPRDGRFIDNIGFYLPTRQPSICEIDADKARKWLSQGASPSETVASLLRKAGITDSNNKVIPADAQTEAAPAADASSTEAAPAEAVA